MTLLLQKYNSPSFFLVRVKTGISVCVCVCVCVCVLERERERERERNGGLLYWRFLFCHAVSNSESQLELLLLSWGTLWTTAPVPSGHSLAVTLVTLCLCDWHWLRDRHEYLCKCNFPTPIGFSSQPASPTSGRPPAWVANTQASFVFRFWLMVLSKVNIQHK